MRFTKPLPVSNSLLAAALVTNAAPIDPNNPAGHLPVIVNPVPAPSFTTLSIPLINHNNGQFWSTSVQVEGSPSAGIDTALDTGGGQFILPSANAPPCQAGNCQRGTLDPSGLQNLTDLNVPFSESFGSGTITGDLFTDTVSIGGVDLGEFKFELATDGTGTALSAGTVGLGFVNNFTPELVSRGIIDTQSFSLLLSESGGEMLLGGINPGNFGGQLQYVKGATAGDGFWRIDIVEFGFSGPTNPSLDNTQFIFDTGTPVTSLPADTIQSIADDFQGTVTNGFAVVPCANIQGQKFSITFAEGVGFSFPIPTFTTQTSDGQCQIQLSSTTGTPTIGANLLTFFYTFFQVESNTMGFALAAQSPVSAQAVQVTDANNLPQVTGVA